MRTLLTVLVAALAVLSARPAEAVRLRGGLELNGGLVSASCAECSGFGTLGLAVRGGVALGPLLLDLHHGSALFDLDGDRLSHANATRLLAGFTIAKRLELSAGPAIGGLSIGGSTIVIGGLHARVAFHPDSRHGLVVSLDAVPLLGREVFFTELLLGVGWGWF